jgi:N-acetylmuramoyl-L-alanine amidase
MAYLTNREQASKARGDDFRNAIADALYEAVARFRAAAIEKPTP